jgi:mevalonate kinase
MPRSARATAPGKVILLGEHAVVYGQPAIAVPVTQVRAAAAIEAGAPGSRLTLVAADLETQVSLENAPRDDPLAAAARLVLDHLSAPEPDAVLTIESTIPIASGMGSGAAVSTALVRALAGYLGHRIETAEVSALVLEVEKLHHGTPSGIDNTVVAYEQPVYFVREQPIERLEVGTPLTLLIGDSGDPSPTGEIVGDVRRAWQRDPARYDALFDRIGELAREGRNAIESGSIDELGTRMDENHELLVEMGVSSARLDALVELARNAGAAGAKLSGAGRGGNVIALVDDGAAQVAQALRDAGARHVICTKVTATR